MNLIFKTATVFFLCLLFLCNSIVNAQDREDKRPYKNSSSFPEKKGFDWHRVFISGFPIISFGKTGDGNTYDGSVTVLGLSPTIGYYLTDRLAVGTNITYTFYKNKGLYYPNGRNNSPVYSYNYATSIYGASLFTRYFFLENFFGQVEYEILNLRAIELGQTRARINVSNFYVGGGYFQRAGRSSGFFIMILYNLNQSVYSPYSNPIIRLGFTIGF